MSNQDIDHLAYQAYVADMRAEGDPLIASRFDRLDERYQKRYRAIAQAIGIQQQTTTTTTEAEITEELRRLPISIQITPRLRGYAFQVLNHKGTLPTFAAAVGHALSLLIGSLIEEKLNNTIQKDNHTTL